MSLRERDPRPGLPTTHYFFSLSRGNSIRTLMLRPAVTWALVALAPLSLTWGAAATAYLAFHDDLMGALVVRQAEMQTAYEDRLAEARAQLDAVASRQLLDQGSFEGKMHDLLSRQARLEQRGSIVAALAEEAAAVRRSSSAAAKPATDALGAIQALSPPTADNGGGDDGSASAYAPAAGVSIEPQAVPPRPDDRRRGNWSALSGRPETPAMTGLTAAAQSPDLDAATRLDLIGRSLERLDDKQMIALAAIDRTATRVSARDEAIVARTGLDPLKLAAPKRAGGVGGPYIPLDVDPKSPAFDRAAARVARDMAMAERLKALMPFVPLRKPLEGDASLTSPFGYRVDPFLGRPALHPGVDLAEAYGAEIHCTGAGRVTHAGPMGGYGNMVEIDHGNGLTTRYAHMSEVLVAGGSGGRAGRDRRPDRLDRPLDRPASALRSAGRRRAGQSGALPSRRRATGGGGIGPREVSFYRPGG